MGFTNLDWACDVDDYKSTPSYTYNFILGPVTWSDQKQYAIYLYSTQEKYQGIVNTNHKYFWIPQSLVEFGFA